MVVKSRGLHRVILGLACLARVVSGFGKLGSLSLSSSACCSPPRGSSVAPTTRRAIEPGRSPPKAEAITDDPGRNTKLDPWAAARISLRDPGCCVVSVCSTPGENASGNTNPLSAHLAVLRERLLAGHGPSDVDLRARINTTTRDSALEDCSRVIRSISLVEAADDDDDEKNSTDSSSSELPACAAALAELARGMASFGADRGGNAGGGVFVRIVCASHYAAHDPVFHTDKAPLRGYATLKGPGTEFVTRPCSPLEYLGLRSLGKPLGGSANPTHATIRRAQETEFIVMKGDYYHSHPRARSTTPAASSSSSVVSNARPPGSASSFSSWWQRASACVHRSPPGAGGGGGNQRVIVSFDLADGDDDREWHEAGKQRRWRAGMTQKKSRLVA